ncbi:MAG: hypothetical protein NXI32_04875 [bacterium]|nr:hypothetical protein [bacterium]
MKILVSGATATVRELWTEYPELCSRYLGRLITPNNGNQIGEIMRSSGNGFWAMDNAAYSNFEWERFWNQMIDCWTCVPMFVTAPDVVGNHAATLDAFGDFLRIAEFEVGYVPVPLAFVLQEGATIESVPWDQIDALFIGGCSEEFKHRTALPFCDEAKRRGKWVHVGRVNSFRRLRVCRDQLKADSIDGSGYSQWPKRILPALQFLDRNEQQMKLAFVA